jgi:hypothetical protein
MKQLLIVLVLLGISSPYLFASDVLDTPGNRQAAAERYIAVSPMDSMMRDMVEKSAQNLPNDQRKPFVEIMTKYVRIDVLERSAISSMVRHFTVQELNALADFYGSPEGQSAIKKFGLYMADVMPVVQQEMTRAAQQFKATKNQ